MYSNDFDAYVNHPKSESIPCLCFFPTAPTQAFDHHARTLHCKPFLDVFRDFQAIQDIIVEIDDGTALDAVEMMMIVCIGIVPSLIGEPFDDIDKTNLRECDECPVHRIERDAGKLLPNFTKHRIGRRVILHPDQLLVDDHTLGRHLKMVLPAVMNKRIQRMLCDLFLHVIII
jgi:hypothetical protein